MTFEELAELIEDYRLVIRPGVVGGPIVARLKSVQLTGKNVEVWVRTEAQADTLEEAVRGCIAKIKALPDIALAYPAPNEREGGEE